MPQALGSDEVDMQKHQYLSIALGHLSLFGASCASSLDTVDALADRKSVYSIRPSGSGRTSLHGEASIDDDMID